MFQVKICGITRPEDIHAANDGGADAIGLNFVSTSPRCVSLELGKQLSNLAARKLFRVGVVRNPTDQELASIVEQVPLDAVQLHGRETPDLLRVCSGMSVIKAVSWSGQAWEEELVLQWTAQRSLLAFLIDAAVPGAAGEIGGGSGQLANWQSLFPRPTAFGSQPIVLAGGLQPSNVARAICISHCCGVDTASGVEQAPGIKDAELIRQFTYVAKQELRKRLSI